VEKRKMVLLVSSLSSKEISTGSFWSWKSLRGGRYFFNLCKRKKQQIERLRTIRIRLKER